LLLFRLTRLCVRAHAGTSSPECTGIEYTQPGATGVGVPNCVVMTHALGSPSGGTNGTECFSMTDNEVFALLGDGKCMATTTSTTTATTMATTPKLNTTNATVVGQDGASASDTDEGLPAAAVGGAAAAGIVLLLVVALFVHRGLAAEQDILVNDWDDDTAAEAASIADPKVDDAPAPKADTAAEDASIAEAVPAPKAEAMTGSSVDRVISSTPPAVDAAATVVDPAPAVLDVAMDENELQHPGESSEEESVQGFGDFDDDSTFGFGQDEDDFHSDFDESEDGTHGPPLEAPLGSGAAVVLAVARAQPRSTSILRPTRFADPSTRSRVRPQSAAAQAAQGHSHVSHAEK